MIKKILIIFFAMVLFFEPSEKPSFAESAAIVSAQSNYLVQGSNAKTDFQEKSPPRKEIKVTGSQKKIEKLLAPLKSIPQSSSLISQFSCNSRRCKCSGFDDCLDMFTSGPCGKDVSGTCDFSAGTCTCKRPQKK